MLVYSVWTETTPLRQSLIDDGWGTPDTYDRCYSELINMSAVYLFLLYDWDNVNQFNNFDKSMVAYVGMSKTLKNRLTKHPVLREIAESRNYVQRWFRPAREEALRAEELSLIQKFDPPWNVQGRTKGVALS